MCLRTSASFRYIGHLHLFRVLRFHRAQSHRVQTLEAQRKEVPAGETYVQRWPSLLLDCVRPFLVSLRKDAQGFSIFRFIANIPAMVMMAINLNPVISVMFNIPAAIIATVRISIPIDGGLS